MFKRLKEKWKVDGVNLFLILTTFALGGTTCGTLGSKILNGLEIEKGWIWVLLYILLITLLWPVCVLLISIPLGQFGFFKNYTLRIWNKLMGNNSDPKTVNLAIWASGKGSNADNIIRYFNNKSNIKVSLIATNNPHSGVIQIAKDNNIPFLVISSDDFGNPNRLISCMLEHKIAFLVLAGFLKKIPDQIIDSFPNKIINIHPALLPAYGGKGMYGRRVHEAVIANQEVKSGISIHYVDNEYDHGKIIFQTQFSLENNETPESLEAKVRLLEHKHYPRIIEELIQKQKHS